MPLELLHGIEHLIAMLAACILMGRKYVLPQRESILESDFATLTRRMEHRAQVMVNQVAFAAKLRPAEFALYANILLAS